MKQKLTEKEIEKFKELQESYDKSIIELGKIEMTLSDLEEQITQFRSQKSLLLEDYSKLKQREAEFKDELFSKYGEGKIDLNTFEIDSI